jgi:hypothetical protein
MAVELSCADVGTVVPDSMTATRAALLQAISIIAFKDRFALIKTKSPQTE